MTVKNYSSVAIVGGTGDLGQFLTREFLANKELTVKVFTRKGSKPEEKKEKLKEEFVKNGAEIVEVDLNNVDSLIEGLGNTEVLISAIADMHLFGVQDKLLEAAKKTGVKLFIPSEFYVYSEGLEGPFSTPKIKSRAELKKSGVPYISYNNGFFIDHLVTPFYNFDIKNRKVLITGKGDTKLTVTTISDVAKFVYQTFDREELKYQEISIVGEITTLNGMVESIKQAIGSDIEVQYQDRSVAEAIINNKDIDYFAQFSPRLQLEIEDDICLLQGNSNHLIPGFEFTSVKDHVKANYQ